MSIILCSVNTYGLQFYKDILLHDYKYHILVIFQKVVFVK